MPIEDVSSGNDGNGSDKSSDSSENDSSESESAPRPSGSRELPPEYYSTMPDNQLGMKDHNEFWGVNDSEGEKSSDSSDEVDPTPEEVEEPQSPEDKMKAYWKKFVVPWPRPKESSTGEDAFSDSGSDSDHLSSDTLQLAPQSSPDASEKSDNDDNDDDGTGSDVSIASSVGGVRDFEEAMGAGSKESHQSALEKASSLSTLQTPRCAKPDT